jgi:hypothetical protein
LSHIQHINIEYVKWYTTSKPKYDSLATSRNPSPKHRSNKNYESNKITGKAYKHETLYLGISNHQK